MDVLLLSSLADLSTDRICYHLSAMGVQFLRLNREQLPDLRIQIDPLRARLTCSYADHVWNIASNLKSVWWRQPTFLRNTPGRALTVEEQLDRSQWSAAMRGLMLLMKPVGSMILLRRIAQNQNRISYGWPTSLVSMCQKRLLQMTRPPTFLVSWGRNWRSRASIRFFYRRGVVNISDIPSLPIGPIASMWTFTRFLLPARRSCHRSWISGSR